MFGHHMRNLYLEITCFYFIQNFNDIIVQSTKHKLETDNCPILNYNNFD